MFNKNIQDLGIDDIQTVIQFSMPHPSLATTASTQEIKVVGVLEGIVTGVDTIVLIGGKEFVFSQNLAAITPVVFRSNVQLI